MTDQSVKETAPDVKTVEAQWRRRLTNAGVDPRFHDEFVLYLQHHRAPGHFLTAVFENNLSSAFGRADELAQQNLLAMVRFMTWDAPSICWGSPEKVREWLSQDERRRAS